MRTQSPAARRILRAVGMLVAALLAAAGLLTAAAPAGAATPITNFFTGPVSPTGECSPEATPSATGAATRSDFCVAYRTALAAPAADDLRSQVIDTPVGFAGDAAAIPQCTDAQFAKDSPDDAACPVDSQIGQALANIRTTLKIPLSNITDKDGVIALAPDGPAYNLEHGPNEVARIGIDLRPIALEVLDQPNVKIVVRVTLKPAPEVGLRSIIDDLPQTADIDILGLSIPDRPLAVDAFSLRFWGSKAEHPSMPADFALLGSDCSTDQSGHIDALSYDGTPTSATSAPYRLTDCDGIPFTPSATYSTAENRPDVTTAATVNVHFAQSDGPRTASPVKTAVVALPPGLSLSGQIASGADGLPICSAEQFGQLRPEHSACPAATALGTVKFTSPLVPDPLTGEAFLGPQPGPGELPQLYIEGELGPAADAPRVKLVGTLSVDDQNRIVTTIDDLPQLLVSDFELTFRGGDHSALVTPPTCGDFQGTLSATPYSAPAAPVTSNSTYSVTADCAAGGGFAPSVAFASANPVAGASAPFTTTITRADRTPRITTAVINLPPGELAYLKGVPECPQTSALAGTCSAETRIGSISSLAGVGPAPFRADGTVYLTERSAGAVAGIALSVPVVFGDVNLGTLNVLGRIDIRAGDLGLQLSADVPERFKGIPLNLQSIAVALDRPGFSLNPTSCRPLTTLSSIQGSNGAVATVPAGFQVSGCQALPFEPLLQAAVAGTTRSGSRPDVAVRIQSAVGSSALLQTYVTLPKGLGFDLAQQPRACDPAEFRAGGCASVAKIGRVSGSLSITDEPLEGDLYLLKAAPGQVLPGIGLAFTGRFAGRVAGQTAVNTKTGQLVTKFDTVPDLPLTSLRIDLQGGYGGVLIATSSLCSDDAESANFRAYFVGQSGTIRNPSTDTQCGVALGEAVPKVSARLAGVRSGKPTLTMNLTAPAGAKVKRIDVQVPSGYTFSSTRARSSSSVVLRSLTAKGKVSSSRIRSDRLRLTLPSAGTTKARLITRTNTIGISSSSVRASKKPVLVTVSVLYTTNRKVSVPLRLTPH